MEYTERGSSVDKLRDEKPFPENSIISDLTQILEGVFPTPKKNIPQRFKACKYPLHCRGKPLNQGFWNSNRKSVANKVICDILSFSRRLSLHVARTPAGR